MDKAGKVALASSTDLLEAVRRIDLVREKITDIVKHGSTMQLSSFSSRYKAFYEAQLDEVERSVASIRDEILKIPD